MKNENNKVNKNRRIFENNMIMNKQIKTNENKVEYYYNCIICGNLSKNKICNCCRSMLK